MDKIQEEFKPLSNIVKTGRLRHFSENVSSRGIESNELKKIKLKAKYKDHVDEFGSILHDRNANQKIKIKAEVNRN